MHERYTRRFVTKISHSAERLVERRHEARRAGPRPLELRLECILNQVDLPACI
jgi:hypothetical protein